MLQLSSEICKNYKGEGTKCSRIKDELYEEFEGCFRHHTSNPGTRKISNRTELSGIAFIPRAEMIHLANATIKLAAVMRSIYLELATSGAIRWSSVLLTNIYIFRIKILQTKGFLVMSSP